MAEVSECSIRLSEDALRRRIASVALGLRGVPYAHQHRGRFVDCIGLIIRAGREAGVMTWDEDSVAWAKYKNYGEAPVPAVLLEGLTLFLRRRPYSIEAKLGSIVLLRGSTPSGPTVARHLGIIVCSRSYVHADNVAEKVMRYPFSGTPAGLISVAFDYPAIHAAAVHAAASL